MTFHNKNRNFGEISGINIAFCDIFSHIFGAYRMTENKIFSPYINHSQNQFSVLENTFSAWVGCLISFQTKPIEPM
jgi:hypothetical protein